MSTFVHGKIDVDDLEAIALGAAVLGAGGGGDPYLGKLLAREALQRQGPVTVVGVAEIPDDARCVMSGSMGAPTVAVEKLAGGGELLAALDALEARLGTGFTHVMPLEAGGMNSMLPIVAAAQTGLPLIDCDAMGRAFPELQMCTPTLSGIHACPMAIADERGTTVVIDAVDNAWAERLARGATIEMGAVSYIALYPQSGAQVRETMIPDTLALADRIGEAILGARTGGDDPAAAVAAAGGGHRLFAGKIVDVQRATAQGFAVGSIRLDGTDDDRGSTVDIVFQNENLVAWRDGALLATVPDLIVVVEADTGQPITAEEYRYGNRVAVLGLPCDRRWRSPDGLAVVGPRAFGHDVEYVPVETLSGVERP